MIEHSPAKLVEYFKTACVVKKKLKDNKNNRLNSWRKYARIFVLGHNLFLEAHSVCFSEQIMSAVSEHFFPPNFGYCLYMVPIPLGEMLPRALRGCFRSTENDNASRKT